MKTLAVIPARYASTRFPGKPLALLGCKPVIQWVWERVHEAPGIDEAVVATDDRRIAQAVEVFGGRALMTSDRHRSGTDRCAEAAERLEREGRRFDVVINVQGDEPFVRPDQLRTLIGCFAAPEVEIATLKCLIASAEELLSPNNVKVVCSTRGDALYFSRQPIPHLRGEEPERWAESQDYYKHVGIYAFRREVLRRVAAMAPAALERSESLEQLRWLCNGCRIRVVETQSANIGIDTPADLVEAERVLLGSVVNPGSKAFQD